MLIKVKTFPNSKKRIVIKKAKNDFDVYVKEKAENGKANDDVILTLSKYLNIPTSEIKIIKGKKTNKKTLKIKQK